MTRSSSRSCVITRARVTLRTVEGMGDEPTRRVDDRAEFHAADPTFYSPLQRWLDEKWPKGAQGMKRQSLEKAIRANVPEEDFFNSGLDLFLEEYGPEQRVWKDDLDEHLSSWMNSYNLEEHYLINTDLHPGPVLGAANPVLDQVGRLRRRGADLTRPGDR